MKKLIVLILLLSSCSTNAPQPRCRAFDPPMPGKVVCVVNGGPPLPSTCVNYATSAAGLKYFSCPAGTQ